MPKFARPGTLRYALKELQKEDQQKDGILGTVLHRQIPDEADPLRDGLFWCDVQPEREGEAVLEYVPMPGRVLNADDDLGLIYVPKKGSEVSLRWVDGRATIAECREWTHWILKKDDANFILWDDKNNIEFFTTGKIHLKCLQSTLEESVLEHHIKSILIKLGPAGFTSAVLGEPLNAWLGSHTHLHKGSPTGPPIQAPALPAHLSKIVKLD